jgi:hypothetical protein
MFEVRFDYHHGWLSLGSSLPLNSKEGKESKIRNQLQNERQKERITEVMLFN